jgi:hypothetical protein
VTNGNVLQYQTEARHKLTHGVLSIFFFASFAAFCSSPFVEGKTHEIRHITA